ncbi:MAG: YqeG family HAD IIIA-type phosphatase [Oscillospiraceae bacterium]|nr:YqeG family HAD IIIA-type phosphatase [Oscillospiraceae bacterium]
MSFVLLPDMIVDNVTQITPALLEQHNISLLMLDFDNTIVPYTTDIPTEAFCRWLQTMAESQIQLCVVSNSRKPRVQVFCKKYGIDCITHARKPFCKGIKQCLQRYGVQPGEAALVGDQIYTDTLGGNSAGVQTILVRAIDNHNFWLKLRHLLEKPFIFAARKRRIDYE